MNGSLFCASQESIRKEVKAHLDQAQKSKDQ